MKRCALVVWLLVFGSSSFGQVPSLINYQGRLVNGTNLVNGTVGLSLRIFDAPTGGSLRYEDSNTVTVVDGLYTAFLGDDTTSGTLGNALFSTNLYLEVMVNGVALSPRERIASSAFTLMANGVRNGGITTAMITNGAVTSAKLATGAVTTVTLADGAVTGPKIANETITSANLQDGTVGMQDMAREFRGGDALVITNPAPGVGDRFGESFGIAGTNRIVVGAPVESASFSDAGKIYLYDLAGNLQRIVTNPAPVFTGEFGRSIAGAPGLDRFAVGATGNTSGTNVNAGLVYVYDLTGNLLVTITNPAPALGGGFGNAIAVAGTNRFIIGAQVQTVGTNLSAGIAYLYDLAGVLVGAVSNPAPVFHDLFGTSVAGVSTDRFVVGALFDDAGAIDAGSAYLYDLNGNLLATIANPAPAASDEFGVFLTVAGSNHFVVAAFQHDAGALNAGSVYLYDKAGNLVKTINNPEPVANDLFGVGLCKLGSDRFAVGAGNNITGRIYVYGEDGTYQITIADPRMSFADGFGGALAGVPGTDLLFAGAPFDDVQVDNAGVAYVFDLGSFGYVVPGFVAESAASAATLVQTQVIATAVEQVANPFRENSDRFGSTIATFGTNRFVVGAPGHEVNSNFSVGAVAIFDDNGTRLMVITNPALTENDNYGYAVAGIGTNEFLVGAAGASNGFGLAYLYSVTGGLLATVTNPAPFGDDDFGWSACGVGPNRFVIAAPFDDAGAVDGGRVYVYDIGGNLLVTVPNPAPGVNDLFGYSVAAVGTNRFVVGAVSDAFVGRAFLYDIGGSLVATILNPDPDTDDEFGNAVGGVGSNRFVVCAYRDNFPTSYVGSAYLYDFDGTLLATMHNPEPALSDYFGSDVDGVGQNYFVIGDSEDRDAQDALAGSAFLYDVDGHYMSKVVNPSPGSFVPEFGSAVAGLTSTRFAIGAETANDTTYYSGEVFLFDIGSSAGGVAVHAAETLTGFIDPGHFSAYADLEAEGYLNNDDFDDLLKRGQGDSRYFNTNDSIRTIDGSVTNPAHSFLHSKNAGMYLIDTNVIGFATTSTQRMAITENGDVIVGTNTPLEKFDVEGNVLVEGEMMYQSTTISVTNDEILGVSNTYERIIATSSVTLNTTTAIANGDRIGQLLILQGASSSFTTTVPDNANTHLSGDFNLGNDDTLTLIWDGVDWNETGESNN